MFTGIIEEIGTVVRIQKDALAVQVTIQAERVLNDVQLGDSIAVNGVCLTVTSFTDQYFTADMMPETVKATSLRTLQVGSSVNLERAMVANGRFGGHFVSGHVDGIGTILEKRTLANAVYYRISLPVHLLRYCITKGSIALDGTSLTLFKVDESSITVSLIPHTLDKSVLGSKGIGDIVNIECDLVGKYIEKFIISPAQSSLTESFLRENGFY
ncbi:riboflavin synthase [Ectobacillus sp. JY-23]|uniref:riboflavin synthase n=1 Tax=Ectobacillus sp. JY-23 TaxID=2933872 RepID=UPI001FF666EB|nr:riboflavin synthase [Ectobacillus sp. JY-23]UOY93888.1 riboflavin synthase [Ectobacillus sp. JY-23]